MNIVIVGAGPTGLGAAYRLDELAYERWIVFEKNNYVGGLSSSFNDELGFTWDVGGHVLFSHYDFFDQAVEQALDGKYYSHKRECWIRLLGTWVPYPFQNNIRYLPSSVIEECINGLKQKCGDPAKSKNFHEWMLAVFGTGIVKYFMEPYNQKVWGVPLEMMSKEWIAERISVVDLARIQRNIANNIDDVSWGPNSTFKFPMRGGTGAIFKAIANRFADRIIMSHNLSAVDIEKRTITFSNGRREQYDALITTIPLDVFISLCKNVPEQVRTAANRLQHNSCLIVGVGVEAERYDSKCWMYFPENNCPFYRVTNFHNYSPWNVPNGDSKRYFSLMCEITYSKYRKIDLERIVDQTIEGLLNTGMLSNSELKRIVSTYVINVPYSYPIPTLRRDESLRVINQFLESRGIFSRGRFGAWKYEVGNMDHSFMQGAEVVGRILKGEEEQTLKNNIKRTQCCS